MYTHHRRKLTFGRAIHSRREKQWPSTETKRGLQPFRNVVNVGAVVSSSHRAPAFERREFQLGWRNNMTASPSSEFTTVDHQYRLEAPKLYAGDAAAYTGATTDSTQVPANIRQERRMNARPGSRPDRWRIASLPTSNSSTASTTQWYAIDRRGN